MRANSPLAPMAIFDKIMSKHLFLNFRIMFVSSAKITVNSSNPNNFRLAGRSLMKIRKRRGPNIDPWGTPNSLTKLAILQT